MQLAMRSHPADPQPLPTITHDLLQVRVESHQAAEASVASARNTHPPHTEAAPLVHTKAEPRSPTHAQTNARQRSPCHTPWQPQLRGSSAASPPQAAQETPWAFWEASSAILRPMPEHPFHNTPRATPGIRHAENSQTLFHVRRRITHHPPPSILRKQMRAAASRRDQDSMAHPPTPTHIGPRISRSPKRLSPKMLFSSSQLHPPLLLFLQRLQA